jgi:hypothetical protein
LLWTCAPPNKTKLEHKPKQKRRYNTTSKSQCMQRLLASQSRVRPSDYMLHSIARKFFKSSYFWVSGKIRDVTHTLQVPPVMDSTFFFFDNPLLLFTFVDMVYVKYREKVGRFTDWRNSSWTRCWSAG